MYQNCSIFMIETFKFQDKRMSVRAVKPPLETLILYRSNLKIERRNLSC